MRWLNGITDAMDMNLGQLQKMVRDRETWHESMGTRRIRHDGATEQQLLLNFCSTMTHLKNKYVSNTIED